MTSSITMLSILLFLHLGSLVVVNAYTLDEPQGMEDVGQDGVLDYLDYLEHARNANFPPEENIHNEKRGRLCFRHGKSCAGAPSFCCKPSKCRCNIFGSNCKCARPGLFAQLG